MNEVIKVLTIKSLLTESELTDKQIGKIFRIKASTISRISSGYIWGTLKNDDSNPIITAQLTK